MAQTSKTGPSEVMVVNETPGEECRIAILDNGHLEELYAERAATATAVGNIYKGRVVNVEPAIQAAFIDYGRGVNGFLHISDLHPRYFPGGDRTERVGKKTPRRERPAIQEALRRGDEVIVQVLKEGIGTKGPTLTSYLSIPGRLIVLMPEMDRVGVSRRIEDDQIRREMRKVLDMIELPEGFGFILRTAGIGKSKTELKRDVAYLMRLWKLIDDRIRKVGAPCPLYTESDLLIRTIRDVMRPTIKAVVVDSESAYDRLNNFLQVIAPRSAPPIIHYRRRAPIFHAFDVERQIELIHGREVPLPSGGALVIEQTEALVAVDVNSGRSRSARDSETNAFRTNCEAVDEICRQLRLRDLGGLLVLDLIDMRNLRHRKAIEDRMCENLKRDRARTTVTRISEFGLLEMTRQRMRPSLRKSYFSTCPTCAGRGEMKSPETIAAEVTRQVGFILDQASVARIELVCSPRVASVLLSRKRRELVHLEDRSGKHADVRVSDDIPVDRVDYYAYDERNADIELERLPLARVPNLEDLENDPHEAEAIARAGSGNGDGTGGGRRRRRRGGPADATAIAMSGSFLDGLDLDFDEEDEEAEAEAAAIAADAQGEAKDEQRGDVETGDGERGTKRRRRRRRRRRGGAGGEDADGTEGEDGVSLHENGERMHPADRGGDAEMDEMDDEPVVISAPAPVFDEETRVHLVAKHLGIMSRDIVERCREEEGFEVRGPMSKLSVDQANAVAHWYAPPEVVQSPPRSRDSAIRVIGDDDEPDDHDDQDGAFDRAHDRGESDAPRVQDDGSGDDGPRRKRRRRGGRRHRRGREEREEREGSGGGDRRGGENRTADAGPPPKRAATPVAVEAGEADGDHGAENEVKSDGQGQEDDRGDAPRRKRSRRRSRGGKSTEQSVPRENPVAESAKRQSTPRKQQAVAEVSVTSPETKVKKKRRSRSRRGAGEESGQAAAPAARSESDAPVRVPARKAVQPTRKSTGDGAATEVVVNAAAPKRSRTLYRNRRAVSPAARSAAEAGPE